MRYLIFSQFNFDFGSRRRGTLITVYIHYHPISKPLAFELFDISFDRRTCQRWQVPCAILWPRRPHPQFQLASDDNACNFCTVPGIPQFCQCRHHHTNTTRCVRLRGLFVGSFRAQLPESESADQTDLPFQHLLLPFPLAYPKASLHPGLPNFLHQLG